MLTSGSMLGIIVGQGLAFIGTLIYFGYKAGLLIEKINGHERRITRLENKVFYEGGDDE